MGIIGHRNLSNTLNRMYNSASRSTRHSNLPTVQGKNTVVYDVADAKNNLSKNLKLKSVITLNKDFKTVVHSEQDGSEKLYFVSDKSEEELKNCWYDKDEICGTIDKDGKVEIHQVGGLGKCQLSGEKEQLRVDNIRDIVGKGMQALEEEISKNNSFEETPWHKKVIATITGKKPGLSLHEKMKGFLSALPEMLEEDRSETILETLQQQTVPENEITYDVKTMDTGRDTREVEERE